MMKKLGASLAILVATAWVGGLWAIGYVAVPVLFKTLPDRQLAGMLAGNMFTLIAYVGMVSATYLLAHRLSRFGRTAFRQSTFWVIVIMLLLALAVQFGIQPVMADLKAQALPAEVMHSPFAGRFRALHGASSIAFLIQSLLGIALLLKIERADQ
jgi:hypothetical protein